MVIFILEDDYQHRLHVQIIRISIDYQELRTSVMNNGDACNIAYYMIEMSRVQNSVLAHKRIMKQNLRWNENKKKKKKEEEEEEEEEEKEE